MENEIAILLVEDTPSDVRLTQEALKRSELHYTMAVVNDGVEALEYLDQAKKGVQGAKLPDMILLDLNMPRKNGHEVLAEIAQDTQLNKIPVVLLTVSQRDEDVMEALKLKMNYYLAKPITAQKIAVLVKQIHDLQSEVVAAGQGHSDTEVHVRLVLAGNPHTTPMVMAKLAADKSERVRARVAENPVTPVELLHRLAKDENAEVRIAVAENPNIPKEVLEELAKDSNEDVRLGLASNRQLPAQILEMLADDENMYVSTNAKKTLSEAGR